MGAAWRPDDATEVSKPTGRRRHRALVLSNPLSSLCSCGGPSSFQSATIWAAWWAAARSSFSSDLQASGACLPAPSRRSPRPAAPAYAGRSRDPPPSPPARAPCLTGAPPAVLDSATQGPSLPRADSRDSPPCGPHRHGRAGHERRPAAARRGTSGPGGPERAVPAPAFSGRLPGWTAMTRRTCTCST